MRNKQRGHNLLELLVGIVVFLTATTGLLGVWVQLSRQQGQSTALLVGQHLAEQVMEESIGAGFTNVHLLNGVRPPIVMKETNRSGVLLYEYKVEIQVTPPAAGAVVSASEPWKVIRVIVKWHDSVGDGSCEFKTLLAQHA